MQAGAFGFEQGDARLQVGVFALQVRVVGFGPEQGLFQFWEKHGGSTVQFPSDLLRNIVEHFNQLFQRGFDAG
ncbi:hypothetical protein SDC9_209862 [bioreactor metagenome]|uniref:Uncharacterized protein n=1 Tax=bioreactor metagenome TaxID=1076179 RepID=A0A645JEK3_9ZZZZ